MAAYVYFVHWPDRDVVKVGYTGRLRQRVSRYTSKRGGRLLATETFDGYMAAFGAEDRAGRAIAKRWGRAFTNRWQAEPLVGQRGSGWTECFIVPSADITEALREFQEAVR